MNEVVLIRCVGCGVPLGNLVPNAGALEHVQSCEKHPLGAELKRLREENASLRAKLALLKQETL